MCQGCAPAGWPVRAFPARGSPTTSVAVAFVGERVQENFYTFSAPVLRVYAALAPSGCGPERNAPPRHWNLNRSVPSDARTPATVHCRAATPSGGS